QELVIEALSRATTPREQYVEYIRAAIDWSHLQPASVRTWILFYLVCSQNTKFRKMHEEMADVGERRIATLLNAMFSDRKLDPVAVKNHAKNVQRLITGALIEILSERLETNVEVTR